MCTTPTATGEVLCRSGEDLAPGAALSAITVTGTVTAGAGEAVANTAAVTSPEAEAAIANNEDEASGVVPEQVQHPGEHKPGTPGTSPLPWVGGAAGGASAFLPVTGAGPVPGVLGLLLRGIRVHFFMSAGRRRHS